MKIKLGYVLVMLSLVLVTEMATPSKIVACTGDPCGCPVFQAACRESCAPDDATCQDLCRQEYFRCEFCCCMELPHPSC
jgi:hypothetical protein